MFLSSWIKGKHGIKQNPSNCEFVLPWENLHNAFIDVVYISWNHWSILSARGSDTVIRAVTTAGWNQRAVPCESIWGFQSCFQYLLVQKKWTFHTAVFNGSARVAIAHPFTKMDVPGWLWRGMCCGPTLVWVEQCWVWVPLSDTGQSEESSREEWIWHWFEPFPVLL